jgi:hypothetical protein
MNSRPVNGRSSKTLSHPIDMNDKLNKYKENWGRALKNVRLKVYINMEH